MKNDKQEPLDDMAFEREVAMALARAETQPPAFLIPLELPVPEALAHSIRQVQKAMDISRSAMRLAFGFLS